MAGVFILEAPIKPSGAFAPAIVAGIAVTTAVTITTAATTKPCSFVANLISRKKKL